MHRVPNPSAACRFVTPCMPWSHAVHALEPWAAGRLAGPGASGRLAAASTLNAPAPRLATATAKVV